MKPYSPPIAIEYKKGFTLVEVMVAMVIGMIGIIIMMQVFAAAEGQKRSTTGTGDAQSNGAMALYTLQRDIRQAGYGFNAVNALGCPLTRPAFGAVAVHTVSQLATAMINPPTTDVPAGDANTDTLLITYGSSEGSPEGDAITLVAGTQLGVLTPTNFRTDHRVIAAPAEATDGCALTMATVGAVTPPNITVASSGAADGDTLFNLGSPKILAYAVRSGNLTVCDYMLSDCTSAANYISIASNIVSLRAQYGRDTTATADGIIDTWDQTTPPLSTPSQATLACLWARTSAVRIAVVARNSQVEKDVITASAPNWEGSADAAIDLTGRANWQNYRYKLFETVVPLRNLPWMALCI